MYVYVYISKCIHTHTNTHTHTYGGNGGGREKTKEVAEDENTSWDEIGDGMPKNDSLVVSRPGKAGLGVREGDRGKLTPYRIPLSGV